MATSTATDEQVPRDCPTGPSGRTERFGLLSLLLAVALILHQLWWGGFEVLSVHGLVVLVALWALLAPTSVPRFLAMLATEVTALALDMPALGSHTVLVLVCGTCLLVDTGATALRARRMPTPGELFERAAPFLRTGLIVVYAAAALAKMNTDFVDPARSCAATMSRQVTWFDPSLLDVPWRIETAIWGTLLVEVSLPVLLAVRRTRRLGLVVGVGFHAVLALAGNVPFSALALALYVAFLPAGPPLRAPRRGLSRGISSVALLVAVGAWSAGAALTVTHAAAVATVIAWGTRLAVLVLVAGAGLVLVACRGHDTEPPRSPMRSPVLVAGILLLVLNATSPYLGLKTESSFEMFSNLRTEAGRWNHLVVPEAMRVFGAQDELVRIIASSDPALTARTAGGTRLVRFEVERYLRSRPGSVVTYAVAGPTGETIRTAGPVPASTPLIDRVAFFEDVAPPGRGGC